MHIAILGLGEAGSIFANDLVTLGVAGIWHGIRRQKENWITGFNLQKATWTLWNRLR